MIASSSASELCKARYPTCSGGNTWALAGRTCIWLSETALNRFSSSSSRKFRCRSWSSSCCGCQPGVCPSEGLRASDGTCTSASWSDGRFAGSLLLISTAWEAAMCRCQDFPFAQAGARFGFLSFPLHACHPLTALLTARAGLTTSSLLPAAVTSCDIDRGRWAGAARQCCLR